MFDLFTEILFLAGLAHLVVLGESRFSALRPEPDIQESDNHQPGCWLGQEHYKLMEKFSPPLEPNGRLVCVLCQCVPVTRKGIIQHYGKAKCVNVKDKCPLPNCYDPILLPGKCCKTCQGQAPFEDTYSLLPKDMEEQFHDFVNGDRQTKTEYKEQRYTALLVGKNVIGAPPVMTKAVAMVYLLVKKEATIQFSMRHAELHNPKSINFIDGNGNILLEHPLKQTPDRKFCGEWYNVPSYYLNYIAKKQLYLTITTQNHSNGEIAGIPEHDTSFEHGTFGALLVSPIPRGIGAYVEFRYSYTTRRKFIDYTVFQDGFLDNKRRKLEYFVTIEKNTKIMHQDTRRIKYKSNKKARLTGSWKRPNKRERRLLARRKLRLRLTSKGGTTMIGDITPVLTCQIFQTVLSSSEALSDSLQPLTSVGSAVFQLHDNGQIAYMIRLYNLEQNLVSLTLESAPTRKQGRRVIQDLTRTFRHNVSSANGFAVGIFKKPTAKDLAMFLTGKLYINVGTSYRQISALRGKIEHTDYDSTINIIRDSPFILTSLPTSPTGVAGHAWLTVTDKCILHYQILLSGLRDHSTITALITGKYDSTASLSENAIYTIIITDFNNGIATGRISDISMEVFHSLDKGTSFIQIDVTGVKKGMVFSNLSISNTCWQKRGGNNYNMLLDQGYNKFNVETDTSCNYEGRIYDDGSSWIPVGNDSCYTCTCHQKKILCDVVICPDLTCKYKVTVPGYCCPKCTTKPPAMLPDINAHFQNNSQNGSCYYDGDKRWHQAGTKWHPYVPPFGYVTCAVCSCMTDGSYDCHRLPCPELNCSKQEAIRVKPNDCCQVCPEKEKHDNSNQEQADTDPMLRSNSCKFGEEEYPDKAKWHPKLSDNEEVACVKCHCKNGKVKCKRKKCTPIDCSRTKNKNVEKCCQCPGAHRKNRGRSKDKTDH